MRLSLKVTAKSARAGVMGWLGDHLKIAVREAPERGKANAAVLRVLEEALALPRGSARIVAGHAAPRKLVEIDGLEEAELRRKVAKIVG